MLLAYNTSLADLDIGLFSDDAKPLANFHHTTSSDDRGVHDRLLAQKTSDLLKELSATSNDISLIAFINGPGSFTGLRIGLSFAKGFAFGRNPAKENVSAAEKLSPVERTLSPFGEVRLAPLLAHQVLLASATSNNPLPANSAILYPGYEKDSVYMSLSETPEKIRYIPIDEVAKMNFAEVVCTPELDFIGIPHRITSIDLHTMAEMALRTEYQISAQSLGNLEPFYGTDFKPNK
ncbi:MAG: hypothetical protein Q8916_03905 [Bacteroidota bacterium]|nr:hypothetical protein [Bacteroidota bacterium]MDP4229532.1 hypothetical protein [Bacteroidota bacterium]MDP4236542.1 hypothetical protein [Bacteroidota bacterium]